MGGLGVEGIEEGHEDGVFHQLMYLFQGGIERGWVRWDAGDGEGEDGVANVGRQIDFAGPVRCDVRFDEALPQRQDVVALFSPGQNLAAGRASGHLVVVFAVAGDVHGELQGFEAVVLREKSHECGERPWRRGVVVEYVRQVGSSRAVRALGAERARYRDGEGPRGYVLCHLGRLLVLAFVGLNVRAVFGEARLQRV